MNKHLKSGKITIEQKILEYDKLINYSGEDDDTEIIDVPKQKQS